MRKILRNLSLLAICILTANAHAGKDNAACSHKEQHAPHTNHFMPAHKMMKRLELSEEQQQQFKALHEENKEKRHVQFQALQENHKQMHELIASGGYTEDKAAQLAKQHGEIAAELARLKAAELAKLYALLTPEQQKKFATMKFEHKKWHSKGDREES